VLFTSRAALAGGGAARLPSRKRRSVVSGTRTIGARDMVRHGRLGAVRVDPATHEVTLDGEPLRSPPSATVPLSSLYLLG
jgi:urease subunit alpha